MFKFTEQTAMGKFTLRGNQCMIEFLNRESGDHFFNNIMLNDTNSNTVFSVYQALFKLSSTNVRCYS